MTETIILNFEFIFLPEENLLSKLSKLVSDSLEELEEEQIHISHQIRSKIISSQNEIVSVINRTKDRGSSL